jgi:hypothetical protein
MPCALLHGKPALPLLTMHSASRPYGRMTAAGFCFASQRGEWSIFNGETAKVTASGFGLASFVIAARQYFDLPAETAEAVQRAIEPEQLRHMASRSR